MLLKIKNLVFKFFPKSLIGFSSYLFNKPKKTFSQYGEDIFLEEIFIKKKGFFIDIGCFHPTRHSNTFKLYKKGWKGINIDVDEYKIKIFNLIRPRDTNIACTLSDKENEVTIYSQKQSSYGSFTSLNEEFAKKHGGLLKREIITRKVKSITIDQILNKLNQKKILPKIDLLCIDVEGYELKVLSGLDFEKNRPKVICAEIHANSLDKLLKNKVYKFITNKNYKLVKWPSPSCIFMSEI